MPDTDYLHPGGGGTSSHRSTKPRLLHDTNYIDSDHSTPPPLADTVHPVFTLSPYPLDVEFRWGLMLCQPSLVLVSNENEKSQQQAIQVEQKQLNSLLGITRGPDYQPISVDMFIVVTCVNRTSLLIMLHMEIWSLWRSLLIIGNQSPCQGKGPFQCGQGQ